MHRQSSKWNQVRRSGHDHQDRLTEDIKKRPIYTIRLPSSFGAIELSQLARGLETLPTAT